MASEEQQETIEEKEASNEAIDLQAIHNPITTENKKGQMEIKSNVLDGNIVNKEEDLVKEETEIPSKLGIFVEPNQIITEKPESLESCSVNLEAELKEQEVLRHEEAVSPLEEPTAQEQQEKINGETENELNSSQSTEQEQPSSDLVLKGNGIQEKIDTEEVMKEDAHQNQISEKDKTEKDAIESNSMVALSEKDSQKEVELPIGNASQNPEEDVTKEVGIPSSTTPLVAEEILEEAKGENDSLEEVQNEQIHQIETAKETMAEEKECSDETEHQNRDISVVATSEETIPAEASQENQTPEMICEEVKQTEDPTLYDQPITIEETSKSDEGSEHMSEEVKVKENDVAATTPLISEEAEESADIKEDTKEEAHQDQIFKEDETGKDASQSTSEVYLPEKYCENETEKTIENARGNPEEEEVTKEVESVSTVTPPVSEEVLEEAKEKIEAVEGEQNEQAAEENWAEEKECNPAEVQNRDVSEVVVSEETMSEKASPEKEAPEMISEEVKLSEDTIAMDEKDVMRQNDNEENAANKDLTSSHQMITNEEICKTDEGSEHISEKSTLETVTTRDITPEIEIKDAETEALTIETDNRDIEKMANEEEVKSPEEVEPSESKDAPMEIEEETLNDFKEEKSEGDNKWKNKETDDEQLDESKAPPSEEEVSAERDTIETKLIKETEGDEIITLDSKETSGNEEVVNNEEEAREMHIAEECDANNDINGDELGEGNGKDDEADKRNVEEISEPAEPINNTEASTDAEIPREEIELQSDNAVSAQLTEGEEALQDTPCESTTFSEMERENTGYKALDSETDNMVVENSQEADPNELPDIADKDASASEDKIKEDGKVDTNEYKEVEQKLEVEEKTEENLFDNIEHETAPSIQNEENPSEKDDNIKNEIIDESSDIEGSTEVTEAPEEDVQNRTSERSYKQDQLVPEKETEQDGLKISSNDNEFETEKLEIVDTSSHGEEKASVILQNDDELDIKLKPEEKIEAETMPNEEITQRVEEVDEEPCITHNKEELPEAESTIECKETLNERSISTIQQDQQSEESDAMPTEAKQSTDDTSVEEGSETNTTLVSSTEQIDERSIAKDEGDKMQEEIIVVGTPKEKTEGESTEKQIEEIREITNPSKVPEVDLSQSEVVAPETENLEVVSDEKLGDESKSTDTDSKSVELENTTHKLMELKESSIESSNTREAQIDQLSQEATDEVSAQENSEFDATLSEQIGEGSIAQEESVILQEEDLKMPKEDAEMIEAAANEKHIEEEIPQTVHPSEITEEQLVESETVGPEAERLEIVSNEKFGDESKLTETDLKSAQMESTPDELIEEKWNANLSSSERSEESEVLLQNTGEELQGEKTDAEMPKEEICQAIEAAEEPCDKHVEGEILKTADPEICNASEELKSIFEQEKATEESASVEEKSDTSAILVPSEGQIKEKENAINESSIVPQSNTESVIIPEEKISGGVETNDEPIDKVITGEISQIVPTSEITEKQLVESEIVGPDAEHLEIISNEKFGDTLNKLIKEKSIVDLSASVEQISERSEESEGLLQNTGEQVQGEKPDAEMPKEEIGQAIEADEASCDKHIEGEICKTPDLEIIDATESKAVLTETESPELEKATEESASVEEKSDATAIFVPGEGQIEEIEIANMESSGVPQSTTESVIVSEEKNSQGIETNDEPSDMDNSVESSKIADHEIHDVVVQTKIVSNDEEVDSEKLGTEIESTELEKATEESTSVEETSDAGADLVPSEGQIEEIEIENKESSVVPQDTIELVTVPEENFSQGIETNEEPSDKHIVGELHEKDISIDNFEASEEIHLVLENKVDQGQTTASPVEQPNSKNFATDMESAFLEKTNGDIDVKTNLEKTTMTSFVEEEGDVINQTDNGSETVPVLDQTHEEKTKLIDEKIVPAETEELQVQERALDTVVTEPENQTKDEKDPIRTETKEEISEIEKVGQEKDIPTEFLKTAEQKVVVDETNEDTEETVLNFSQQNKEVEEEADQSEGPEHRDFASIVSSFLINKVLSEENPRTDGGAKQKNDASFIPKALDEETIPEITTDKKEPETTDEEISHATSLREEEKPEIQEREEENGEKKAEDDGQGDGVEQDYLPVSQFLMDKILRQEENKNLAEEKAIEETDKQLVRDDAIQVEEKTEENSNPVMAPEVARDTETPSSFAEVARDFEKEETLIKKVDDTFVSDGGISIEEKTEETSSVEALPKQEGEGRHSSIEVARYFEEEKPADDAPTPVEDKNETVVSDVGILSVEENEEGNRSGAVVPEQEGEKNISPIEAVRDFEKEDKSIEQKNEALVTNEGISIIEKIEDNTGEEMRDFDKDVKCAEIKDESLVSVDGACTLKRIEEENNKVALHELEGETGSSLVEEVEDLANGEENKDLEEVLVNPCEFSKPEKIIDQVHETEMIADEETPKDVEENYVLVEREVNQFEESKEILMQINDATIPNLEKKQNNSSAEIQDAESNLVRQVENTENGMKNSSVSCKEIEESLPDIPKLPMARVETDATLQEPLEKQRDLEATEIKKELVGNETDYIRGEEQVKEVTGTVVERIQNKNQELTEIEATKIEEKSEEIKDEEHKEEEKEEEQEEEEKHRDETEIIARDLTVKAEARETEMKSAQKKSHNILSGVGSKVKHSLAKVKKAITGKSKNVSPSAK